MKFTTWLGLGAAMCAGLASQAAEPSSTNRYSEAMWAPVDMKSTLAAAADITLARYPDCDEATVEKKLVRVYRPDGTGECQDETYVKVLTEKGKRGNRTLSLSFTIPYSTEEVSTLEVIKPDGTIIPVDIAANSKESIDESQMQMNISDPNSRVLQVNIPKVEINDVVHAISRQVITRSYMDGEYAEENVFEDDGYIRHVSYEVHSPATKPLKQMALRDPVAGTIKYNATTNADSSVVHHWEVNNVPRMFSEPSMPSADMVLQRILVSTTPNWHDVSKWYWNLSKSHLDAMEPAMTNEVTRLTTGAKTDMDKLRAIFYDVSKNIRYMGLTTEKDRPGFEPHDVKMTFDKKYGVCRDKAALLVSLLRVAGLNSYPVLISVGTKRDKQVADPFFNHAIVCVEMKKGKYVLMDPTDEHTRNLLPSYDCNQSYLVCKPEGETLQISPIEPPEDHMMEIKTTGELTAAGTLHAVSELSFNGVNDDAYRNVFSHMKSDDERRFFERTLKRAMPGARLDSFKLFPEDMMDTSVPVHAQLEYSADGMTASGNGKSMVNVPWIGKNFGMVNFIVGNTGLEKRKYPMETEVACGMKENIALKLSGGFSGAVSMPTCPSKDDDCVGYDEAVAYNENALSCSREFKLKVVEFTPKQYLNLKQTLKSIEYDERKVPVLTTDPNAATEPEVAATGAMPPVDSDAQILNSHKELILTSAHDAVFRVHYSKRILNYAGKIREAEIKMDYNPSCQEARVVKGIVVSKDGKRQEISTNEINFMDAGWNPSAKRYTGGKILVANLPSVEIGSTIEVEIEIVNKNKPYIAGFELFQLRDAMDKKSFDLISSNIPLQKMMTGTAGMLKETSINQTNGHGFSWTATNIGAVPGEGQTPPDWSYSTGVMYYAGDMQDYLKTLYQVFTDQAGKNAKAAEVAKQVIGTAKTKLEQVRAIRDYVAKSVRHAGPSFTSLPLSELSAADTTLGDGYGHSADRAILLYAMLKSAGLDPQFVLASGIPEITSLQSVSSEFPMPYVFQEPLVRVSVDNQFYYLNDSDQYAKLGATSYDGFEIMALPVSDKPVMEIAHAANDCGDNSETLYTLSVGDNGKTRIGITYKYYGENFGGKNRYFSELPPEERRRYYQEAVSEVAQGARPVGDLKTDFSSYPGIEQFTVDVDNYTIMDGKYLYFDLPFTPAMLPAGADRRALPLYLGSSGHSTVRTEIDLPAKYKTEIIAPHSRVLDAPENGGKATVTSESTGSHYVVTYQFDHHPAIIPPEEYSKVLKVESALEQRSSKAFLFSSAAP